MGCCNGYARDYNAGINSIVDKKGSTYGIFNSMYGISWFIGSIIMGMLYDISVANLVTFSIIVEVLTLPLLFDNIKVTIS